MYSSEDTLVLSATDLVGFLECEHLLQLERRAALGEIERPQRPDAEIDIISALGDEHEQKHLDRFKIKSPTVVEISDYGNSPADLRRREAETLDAMRRGADVIYQAVFFDGRWLGKADFLLRTDRPSLLGNHSYEVGDTKLARHAKTNALLQVALYSEHVARLQGCLPDRMHLILGDDSEHAFPVADYISYARTALARMEQALADSPVATYPDKVAHCGVCRWRDVCADKRLADDHLSLVAGIRRDQIKRLGLAGIRTMAQLAAAPDRVEVDGIGERAQERIQTQARLQVGARESGRRLYKFTEDRDPGIGLAALPPPSPGDLFFDMEGDPFASVEGLEYLFGVIEQGLGGGRRFHRWWAHDSMHERQAFEAVVDFIVARWRADPDLHVYHYAQYEPESLKKLMGRYGSREAEVDDMLRNGLLVDLYQVVRQGVRISEESYSLKSVEHFYMEERDDSVTDAGSSIVQYERYRRERDPAILDGIEAYNRVDCESTALLRDWLEKLRVEAADGGRPLARPQPKVYEPSPEHQVAEAEVAALTDRLLEDRLGSTPEETRARWLLAQSLSWHRREDKADWWAYFGRLRMTDAELVEEREAIGELIYLGEVDRPGRSVVLRYAFDPEQEYKLGLGSKPIDPRTQATAGTVVRIDPNAGHIDIKHAVASELPHPTSLIPPGPLPTTEQKRAIQRLANRVLEGGLGAPGTEAASDLLLRNPPRTSAGRLEVLDMDRTTLPIQGPPGTGKTYTGARMVLDLVARGRRVGVTATSHKVISNFLQAILEAADERGQHVSLVHKCDEPEHCGDTRIGRASANDEVEVALLAGQVDVVGATPWLWSRAEFEGSVSHLFIDEAGQMSLANVLAIAGSAQNLVLLGDPQQLAQPTKGAHPPGADVSALGLVLDGADTLPEGRGLFLDTSWRMHPDVCRFISQASYDGRLYSEAGCANQRVDAPGLASGTGLRFEPAGHWGNRTSSPEEAEMVARLVEDLLRGSFTDRDGRRRPLSLADILVVAPFNAQVARVRAVLPENARVGTVDKFQGQEAPVVIYSLATSTPDDLPRNMEFLYSLNRLNVAVSRAQALAIVVCNPELLRVRPRSPDQMRLANALCLLVEQATRIEEPAIL